MAMNEGLLPEFLQQGELARLIPVGAARQRERAACSVLLASLRVVHPFARDLLSEIGKRVGNRASIEAYTEVVFRNQPDERCRPDGLLILDTVRRQWKAIIEAKLGQAKISTEQLRRYHRLAKANGIDAIITISNELTPRPDHIPYDVPTDIGNGVQLYHWSWAHLGAVANLLQREEDEFDDEQHFILGEVVRYLDSETTDGGFQQMGPEWPRLVLKVFSMGEFAANDVEVVRAIRCWHQQQASVGIWLGRELQRPVTIRLNRNHRDSQRARLLEDAEEFTANKQLLAAFECSTLAAPIELVADALRRNVTCRCTVQAPQDKRRYQSRMNWLLNQLPDGKSNDTMVHINWDNGQKTSVALSRLRRDEQEGRVDGALPMSFELSRSIDLANKFAGPKTFVEGVDAAIWLFYDTVARHVHAWQPAPISEAFIEAESDGTTPVSRERTIIGKGDVPGGIVTLFDDNSIELETASGRKWFPSLADLEKSFRPSDGSPSAVSAPPANSSGNH